MNPQGHRFTIFDMMDAKGVFAANPANTHARDPNSGDALYVGPVEYPKMFYHPEGLERQVEAERKEATATGIVTMPARFEMVSKVAKNAEEGKVLRDAGWHDHPAKALLAAGKEAPAMSSGARISDLEAQMAAMKKELDAAKALNAAMELGAKPKVTSVLGSPTTSKAAS